MDTTDVSGQDSGSHAVVEVNESNTEVDKVFPFLQGLNKRMLRNICHVWDRKSLDNKLE